MLPTLVLGGLHWRQLDQEQAEELAQIPLEAEVAGRRLVDAMRDRLQGLLREENQRSFEVYQERVYPADLLGAELASVPTPLSTGTPPDGILGWFAWDFRKALEAALTFEMFAGERWEVFERERAGLARTVEELIEHDFLDGFPRRISRYGKMSNESVKLSRAVVSLSPETDVECLRDELPALERFEGEPVEVYQYDFHVRFFLEPDGTPRVIATRLVLIDGNELLKEMPSCFSYLTRGATLIQGFFIDPQWLFGRLPRSIASQVLRSPEVFHGAGDPPSAPAADEVVERIFPVDALGFETYEPEDANYGELQISISTGEIRARHARQTRGFFAVALMLLLSLGTGMVLLMRSVRRDLEQVRRTENFVAAVTHELRTPVSAIRLYGEMLRDGWTTSPEKRDEYYGRIVDEAHRLETMVERVLEKSQVASVEAKPQPGDANEFIAGLVRRELSAPGDLRLELAPELPAILMNPESLRSIVLNLVENARKYAPPRPYVPKAEPILIRTELVGGKPRLEVLDRGPGIPDEDKRHLFEAFYRRGDETTRRSRGTGLGLHLVKIQAQSMGGDVEVLDRPGGGTVFRVQLKAAPATS